MIKTRALPLGGAILLLVALVAGLVFVLPSGYTVKAQTTTKIISPSADAYVLASSPTTNFGTKTNLRVDNSPITRSYLRFVVSGLNGAPVTSAKLRIYANSSDPTGFTVHSLSNNTWTESGITYKNAPAPGTSLATSPKVVAGQWIEVNISSYIKAQGTYNLVLTINNSTNTSLGARESGAHAPQLLVTYGTAAPTATKIASTATKPAPTATKPASTATNPAPIATNPAPTATPPTGLTKVSLTKGPDVIYVGSNTAMKIFWQWTSNTSFSVDWGTNAAYGSSSPAISTYDTTNHLYAYTITNLIPATKYYYRVVTGSQYSGGTFFTAPAASATGVNFVSYGDDRSNPSEHNAVAGQVDNLFTSDPSYQTLNLSVGDLVSNGDSDSTWTSELFAPTLTGIRTELANLADLSVIGNHEGLGALFVRYFPMPFVGGRYWSFDYGPMHVIMMDQYTSYGAGSAEYNWLKSDLAASTKKWKIIVLHEPGWSAGGGHGNNTTIQSVYEPLFEQYKVALVLGGHNHYYARAMVNGIPELTVGTGGAPLYSPASGQPNIVKTYSGYGYAKISINGSALTGWFISASGSTIDTFSVTR